MEKKAFEISEAELEVIKILWKTGKPMTVQEVCNTVVNKKWKYTTASTLLSRLVEKGAVAYEKKGKSYLYYPIIKKNDYKQLQTKNLVSKLYDGSVKNLAVSLFKTGEMSADDIEEIKKMFNL
ncbi:BlaI/MecI/CopY family transcriptional regulator [Inediibacterium massiliense]|uniref:BlaI/MecI/CopY family transcriptional regulator n=1 Tax=Inediibacterium massiliense TaxID=1658111 RepID=UPI0006B49020|nr:BlaI/MecI/CopY family transcriptional regulator [Inediibacterium massiliense]